MNGRVVVFLGPTMPAALARTMDDRLEIRPPAAHGDLYRAARSAPDAIVLIDGVFDWVRAVWHKEILWALEHGVRVIGASSMGALRAAECAAFGMEPCGVIAAAYVDGTRTSDGDVAQTHATVDDEWRPLSEALVNVDATLDAALSDGVVSSAGAKLLASAARACFYADRTWPLILDTAPVGTEERDGLRRWLRTGRVDQKRLDATLAIGLALDSGPVSSPIFVTAPSEHWRRAIAELAPPAPAVHRIDLAALLAD